jgi:hypothetical protein
MEDEIALANGEHRIGHVEDDKFERIMTYLA